MALRPWGLWRQLVARAVGVASMLATAACGDAEKVNDSTAAGGSSGVGGSGATSGTGGTNGGGGTAGGSGGTSGDAGTGGDSGTGGTGGASACKSIEPAGSGELRHALTIGTGTVVHVDTSCDGSFVAAGYFSYDLSLPKADGSNIELTGVSGVTWMAAFDADGTARWAKDLLIGPTDGGRAGPFPRLFADGSLVSGGTFGNAATFASGEPNETSFRTPSDQAQGYIVKYGADGRLLWAKHVEGIDTFVLGVYPGPNGSTYADIGTQDSRGRIIGPGEIDFPITSSELAVAVLDADGRFVRACTLSGTVALEVATLESGAFAVAGLFEDGAVVGGGTPSSRTLTSSDGSGRGWVAAVLTPELEISSLSTWSVSTFGEGGRLYPMADGSFVSSGSFQTSTLVIGGPEGITLTRRGGTDGDGYLGRFAADGALSWVAQLSSTEGISSLLPPKGLPDGSTWIGGQASGDDGQSITIEVTSGASASRSLTLTGRAAFFVRFSATGEPSWIAPLQSDDSEYASAFSVSPVSLIGIGRFSGTLRSGTSPVRATFEPTELSSDAGFVTVFGP